MKRSIIQYLAILTTLMAIQLNAQIQFEAHTIVGGENSVLSPISVYAADMDGDGDMDVLSASSEDDEIVRYENLLIEHTDNPKILPTDFNLNDNYPNPFNPTTTIGYELPEQPKSQPANFILHQNYPNPFNPTTTIKYGLPEAGKVSLVIYDIRGNIVNTIASGSKPAGWYEDT